MENGEIIIYKELEWYIIKSTKATTTLLLRDSIDADILRKCVNNTTDVLKVSVTHNIMEDIFSWDNSYIKKELLPQFKKNFKLNGEITLPTLEEIRCCPAKIRKCDNAYWTKSPCSIDDLDVFFVRENGRIGILQANAFCSIRPLLTLSTQKLIKDLQKETEIYKVLVSIKIEARKELSTDSYHTHDQIVSQQSIRKINTIINNHLENYKEDIYILNKNEYNAKALISELVRLEVISSKISQKTNKIEIKLQKNEKI